MVERQPSDEKLNKASPGWLSRWTDPL